MPGFTSRGYPYSIATDPADVAGALEDLARAVDADIQEVSDSVSQRPVFRVRGQIPQPYYTLNVGAANVVTTFAETEVDIGGALTPIAGVVTSVTPQLPGFYFVHAALDIPRAGSTVARPIGIVIQKQSGVLTRQNMVLPTRATDGVMSMAASTSVFMDGFSESFQVIWSFTIPTASFGSFTLRNRTLTVARMTES